MKEILFSRIEGSGKPLLILHGFLGMSDNWKTLSGRLSKNGFQVHSLDLRNHGHSFHSDDFSYQLMMDDILNYCQEQNLQKISIIGHSMGGKLAMFFAVTNPDMLEKLIIVDVSPKEYPKEHHHILEILKVLNAIDFDILKERKEIENVISNFISDFGTVQFLMKLVYRNKTRTERLAFRVNLHSLTKNYNNINTALPKTSLYNKSVLFLKGENSDYIQENDISDILKIFPKATIETVANSGHWIHADNPNDFFDFSIKYLQG